MAAPSLRDVYNAYVESATGDLDRDLAERGLPPELAHELARCWADAAGVDGASVHPTCAAFLTGLQVGADWARVARRTPA